MAGAKVSIKLYERMEARMAEQRAAALREQRGEEEEPMSFEEALDLLLTARPFREVMAAWLCDCNKSLHKPVRPINALLH